MRNRFKGLDLIDRLPNELWMELSDTVEETGIKAILRKRNAKKQNGCTKKDLHDTDNHDGVVTHLEPDILECEVKWALENITKNKASGCDGIPVELF